MGVTHGTEERQKEDQCRIEQDYLPGIDVYTIETVHGKTGGKGHEGVLGGNKSLEQVAQEIAETE